jgi:3-hydroxyisobutyrate dehydrogenase-like beta-hydroxyacid dehydrogenase
MSANVGFIGLGIMGQGMAARLLSEGVAGTADKALVVWNRTGVKCKELKEQFADKNIVIKDTAKEVVEACGITYSMLSTPEASAAVFDAADGVLAGVGTGKCIVDCATLAEADMQRMSEAVTSKGGYVARILQIFAYYLTFAYCPANQLTHLTLYSRFLEAPVSGSKGPAAQGALIFLCAGDEDLFHEVVGDGFKAMGKASHFFSKDVGAGTRAKLVVNSLMGTMLAAFAEGLALSESVGLDPNKMIEVIGQGAIACPMYALKGPKMVVKDHAPNFPLKHSHKDMALACDMAKEAGVQYSVMNTAEQCKWAEYVLLLH